MGQDQSSMERENEETVTLREKSLDALVEYIQSGKCTNVCFMVGAGISTSAGIPDFRSENTGLYANLARLNLPHPEAVFELSYFRENPVPFYALAHELYPGKFSPTISHALIALFQSKGMLLKCFTQNIDCLEQQAGVQPERIMAAHGSFATQRCIECKTPFPDDEMKRHVHAKTVPTCLTPQCGGLVKPDIVFFGEALPSAFFDSIEEVYKADLAIVMGTSLSVAPFSTLPWRVPPGVPRLLINRELVGGLGVRGDDVVLLVDCDVGARRLAEKLGWLEELEERWESMLSPEKLAEVKALKSGERSEPQTRKEMDERIAEEVDRIAKEVGEGLDRVEQMRKSVGLEAHASDKIQEENKKLESEVGNIGEGVEKVHLELENASSQETAPEPVAQKPAGQSGHVYPGVPLP